MHISARRTLSIICSSTYKEFNAALYTRVYRIKYEMCIPDLREPFEDYSLPENEEAPRHFESSSDSSFDDDDSDDIDDSDIFYDSDEDKVDEEIHVHLGAHLADLFNAIHPPPIFPGTTIGALSFLPDPNINIIALGLSNGIIKMYTYDDVDHKYLREIDDVHLNKVTVLEFNETGKYIYSACKNKCVSVSDVETGQLKVCFKEAHTAGLVSFVTALSFIDENLFATGGTDGVVNVWDVRANGCRFSLKKSEDSINSMITINDSNNQPTLASTSDDGTLTIIDLSTKKVVVQSEPYKSALTSCVTMKQKTKVVCGTGVGSLITFNTTDFSVFNEEFPCFNKDAAVTKLVPLTDNVVISALDNGNIRATHLFPNYYSRVIGHHQNRIDILGASPNGQFLAATTPFSIVVAFCFIGFLLDQ
ncbi:hypothetical protein AGLY_001885 [Aphis glycines]|uniref:WD repeat-containing protein 55 homolog n=1 Tax=Aphis glycines TaxID=307491 RepID=A0A6G0U4M2_APHGL|nr:hypothetical protein AGLY_001885 [Aphis glycines]